MAPYKTIQQAKALEVEASEERYKQLVEQQADFVLLSMPDTSITFANRALCKALGVELSGMVGKRWIDFANPDDLQQVLHDLKKLSPSLRTVSYIFAVELRFIWKVGLWSVNHKNQLSFLFTIYP
jgi:PAS domain S-box-containing protein